MHGEEFEEYARTASPEMIPGYEVCQVHGVDDFVAEGMAAYVRAPPEDVEGARKEAPNFTDSS